MSQADISRADEAALYRYLQLNLEGDALRYELIARKVQRTADGVATDWERSIALDWLKAMNDLRTVASAPPNPPAEAPFASLRSGKCGNPYYQAYLDTLEQHELDAIVNNVPYFAWNADRCREAKALGIPLGQHIRRWADQHLAKRLQPKEPQ